MPNVTETINGPEGAQALILLATAGATAASWDSVVSPLAEQFRVVALAPTGATLAELGAQVIAALDELSIDRAHIAGAGIGGLTAVWLAIHEPRRVSRIALVGSALGVSGGAAVDAWITPALAGRDAPLVASLQAQIDAAGEIAEVDSNALAEDLGRVAALTVVVAGAADPLAPADALRAFASQIPDARVVLVPGAAHLVAVEQPAILSRLLLEHFGSAATLELGYASRRVALGDAHVDRTIAGITEFTEPFQNFLTRYCWGEVWTRPGLSRRDRSFATIAALVTLGAEHEIGIHVRAGLRHGLEIQEIQEMLQHLALYAGLPRAFGALQYVQRILIEDGLLPASPA